MVVADAHRFPLGIIYDFIIKGKIRYRNKQNAVLCQVAAIFFQESIIVIIGLARIGKIKALAAALRQCIIIEIIESVGTAQIPDLDFLYLDSERRKFSNVEILVFVNFLV